LFFRNYPELAGGSKVIVPEKAEKKVKEKKDGSMIIGYSTVLASISSIIITILKN
jgi:hypothetical protein